MLPIRFEAIGAEDLMRLLEMKTVEHRTLEYKERLASGNREERAEFLSDISSFANAAGGDILFGIAEERDEDGKATGIPGAIKPLDMEKPWSRMCSNRANDRERDSTSHPLSAGQEYRNPRSRLGDPDPNREKLDRASYGDVFQSEPLLLAKQQHGKVSARRTADWGGVLATTRLG